MNDLSWEDQLELCRPDSEDLDLPEFAALRARLATDPELRAYWLRLQDHDRLIRQTLHDVPLPEVLLGRLRQACETDTSVVVNVDGAQGIRLAPVLQSPAAPRVTPGDSESRTEKARSLPRETRWNRRVWALVLTTAALVAGLACWPYLRPRAAVTPADLPQEAVRWRARLGSEDWRSIDTAPGRTHPPSSLVRGSGPLRWQTLSTRLDPQTVVYDYAASEPESLLLFVARPEKALELPSSPPLRPVANGGWAVASWYRSGVVYVVSVRGGDREYQRAMLVNPRLASAERRPAPSRAPAPGRRI